MEMFPFSGAGTDHVNLQKERDRSCGMHFRSVLTS